MDRLHALIHKSNIEYITTRSYDGEKHSSVCTTVLYNSVSLVRYLEHGIRCKSWNVYSSTSMLCSLSVTFHFTVRLSRLRFKCTFDFSKVVMSNLFHGTLVLDDILENLFCCRRRPQPLCWSFSCFVCTCIPWTAIISCILQAGEMSVLSCITTSMFVPWTTILSRILQAG